MKSVRNIKKALKQLSKQYKESMEEERFSIAYLCLETIHKYNEIYKYELEIKDEKKFLRSTIRKKR